MNAYRLALSCTPLSNSGDKEVDQNSTIRVVQKEKMRIGSLAFPNSFVCLFVCLFVEEDDEYKSTVDSAKNEYRWGLYSSKLWEQRKQTGGLERVNFGRRRLFC
eukprot:TRINITY_DN2048_c0_g4_i2.p2 TRINITY_DN2048_c0_g4~~TRINITY_DN2048_c0_g4_i2.p2  ORF type:complete len:104 (+),score=25.03 TRINITY_DN2048_c0_g4_i2:664-975(+)